MPQTACATTATATIFNPCSQAASDRSPNSAHPVPEQDQRQRRGHRKPDPGGQRARQTGAQDAEAHADLAARRAGQELAQRDDIGIAVLVEPFAALDAFGAEIAEMRDRPAKAGQTEPQKGPEYFDRRAGWLFQRTRLRPARMRSGRQPRSGCTGITRASRGRAVPSMSSWSICRWRSTVGAMSTSEVGDLPPPGREAAALDHQERALLVRAEAAMLAEADLAFVVGRVLHDRAIAAHAVLVDAVLGRER